MKIIEYNDDRFSIKLDDGIVHIVWKMEKYTYEDVDLGIKKRLEIIEDKSYPIFSDFTKVQSGTLEARQRLSSKDAGKGVIAVAALVKSKTQRILFNFFDSIYKSPAPTKLFNNKEDALKWLVKFKPVT